MHDGDRHDQMQKVQALFKATFKFDLHIAKMLQILGLPSS